MNLPHLVLSSPANSYSSVFKSEKFDVVSGDGIVLHKNQPLPCATLYLSFALAKVEKVGPNCTKCGSPHHPGWCEDWAAKQDAT